MPRTRISTVCRARCPPPHCCWTRRRRFFPASADWRRCSESSAFFPCREVPLPRSPDCPAPAARRVSGWRCSRRDRRGPHCRRRTPPSARSDRHTAPYGDPADRCAASSRRAGRRSNFSSPLREPPLRPPYRSPTPERLWLREPLRNRKAAALCLRRAAAHRPLRSATSRSPANASPLRRPAGHMSRSRTAYRTAPATSRPCRCVPAGVWRAGDSRLHAPCDSGIPAPRRNRHTHTLRPVAARRSPTSCRRRRRAAYRVRKSVGRSSFGSFIGN